MKNTLKALSDPAEFFNLALRKAVPCSKSGTTKTRNAPTIDEEGQEEEQDQKNKLVAAATLTQGG